MASLVPLISVRHNTVNFFMRNTGRQLWKTVTSLSPAGIKKGRAKTRQPILSLSKFYRIGAGPLKTKFPGLNAPLTFDAEEPITISERTKEEIEKTEERLKIIIAERPKKKRIKEKLHPLERGFVGSRLEGQKLGPPAPVGDVNFDDFQTYCLQMRKTTNMTSYGRRHTMKALIVTGNGRGLAGYGVGQAGMSGYIRAIVSGMKIAARKLIFVELLESRTIYQDFFAECRGVRIFAQRRPQGFGIIAHPRIKKICEVVGIKDIECKVEGSTKNYIALTHAFFVGLINQETHQQLAERRGLHVVELSPAQHYFPVKVASPLRTPLRSDDDIRPAERMLLDDFYGEGRLPFLKKRLPFYRNLPSHLLAEELKHRYRNRDDSIIRLMADDVVSRWTRSERRKWAENRHQDVVSGLLPLPKGIGLTEIITREAEA